LKSLVLGEVRVRHAGEIRHRASFSLGVQIRLDSGLRRKDGNTSQLPWTDFEPLGLEPLSVLFIDARYFIFTPAKLSTSDTGLGNG
jgi:hypothetical protein